MKEIKVEWSNVWTSKGKLSRGDVDAIPDDEADALKAAGAVSMKRGRKPEADDA